MEFLQALHAILLATNACRRLAPAALPGKGVSPDFAKALNLITEIEKLKKNKQPRDCQYAKDDAEELRDLIVKEDFTAYELYQLEIRLIDLYSEISNIITPEKIPNDDELRNINSFEYLRNLALYIPDELKKEAGFAEVWDNCQPHKPYDIDIPYGNYYTKFLLALEDKIKKAADDNELKSLDKLVAAIYLNENFALDRAYLMNRDILGKVRQADYHAAQKHVRKRLKQAEVERKGGKNVHSPVGVGSGLGQLLPNISPWFKPMTTTSQPSMVHFAYKSSADPQQLRFGTQGQIVALRKQVNPIFERWLKIQKQYAGGKEITHIYFNNLSRLGSDEVKIDWELKSREDGLTKKLEKLEKRHSNVAVITMPSEDKDNMMNHLQIKERRPTIPGEVVYEKIFSIAMGISTEAYGRELYISPRVRRILFDSEQEESDQFEKLLANSFAALGFSRDQMLSRSDQQAIYFHFIKFELANFILDKIKPFTFNFSCKDAIDRGGVSSAYYNLLKSIEKGQPLSEYEFECILHGAPILVKGRPMNHHTVLIWNTLDAYLNAHQGDKRIPDWLPAWRDRNAPNEEKLYGVMLEKCLRRLEAYIEEKEQQIEDPSYIATIFTPEFKLKVAQDLLEQLQEHQASHQNLRAAPCLLLMDKQNYAALHDGMLFKEIVEPLENNGLLMVGKKPKNYKSPTEQSHSAVSEFEMTVKRVLASRQEISSADRTINAGKQLKDKLKKIDGKLKAGDPQHTTIATDLKKLKDMQKKLSDAKAKFDADTSKYSPAELLSFSTHTQVVTGPADQLQAKITQLISQGPSSSVSFVGTFSDTAEVKTTKNIDKDTALVGFTDIETGMGLFKKTTTVVSVQRLVEDAYHQDIYCNPAQLSRFGTKGYLQWSEIEFKKFYHANPEPDRHMIINDGDDPQNPLPEKLVRFVMAFCEEMNIPYTNNTEHKVTSGDKKLVRERLAQSPVSVDSKLSAIEHFIQNPSSPIKIK